MSFIKSIFSVLSFCSVSVLGQDNSVNYGKELIKENFLKYTDVDKITKLEKELNIDFQTIYADEIYRFVQIDAEELAEFNFSFVNQINKVLKKRDFSISVEKDKNHHQNYTIYLNSGKIILYDASDMKDFSFWDKASHRFFSKLNQLLQSKKIEEQFYLMYEGNDLSALLLTENQYKIIVKAYKKFPKDTPYLPKNYTLKNK